MNPFQPMTYRGCANPKKNKFIPTGKYEYDVFYTLYGDMMTGYTRGNNQLHATENFYMQYEMEAKITGFHRYKLKN